MQSNCESLGVVGLTHLLSVLGQVLHSHELLFTQMALNLVARFPGLCDRRHRGPVGQQRALHRGWTAHRTVTVLTAVTLPVDTMLGGLKVSLEDGLGNEDLITVWALQGVVIVRKLGCQA